MVDPTDSDHIYAVRSAFGTQQVFESTDAGQQWTNISGTLPSSPAWSLAFDPRTGYLYVGTDEGVYMSDNDGTSWSRLGVGLPDVAVHSLDLNQTTDILTIGTYGRGVYQISLNSLPGVQQLLTFNGAIANTTQFNLSFGIDSTATNGFGPITYTGVGATDAASIQSGLDSLSTIGGIGGSVTVVADPTDTVFTVTFGGTLAGQSSILLGASVTATPAVITPSLLPSGALTAVSGNSQWTGPVVLGGNTTIAADGSQALQNGVEAATLTITGTISDQMAGTSNTLTKVGQGTVILAQANVYAGQTVVQQGVLEVDNALALSGVSTIVQAGATLELNSNLYLEPVTLYGNGIASNGHNQGALYSISTSNIYTGTLTLATDSTIGVASSTDTLTIGDGLGHGTIRGTQSLVKEGLGTLILDDQNTYGPSPEGTFDVPNILEDPSDTLYPTGTVVSQGVLLIQNSNALGASGNTTTVLDGAQLQTQAITQTLTLTGATPHSTQFNLAFNGVSTATNGYGPITYTGNRTTDAADIENALNSLSTIGAYTGTITGASNPLAPAPIIITTASTGNLRTGDQVTISGVGGNTTANGTYYIKVLDANDFALYSNSGLTTAVTANGAYTGGGSWVKGVVVTPDASDPGFTITFNDSLAGLSLPLLSATLVQPSTASVSVVAGIVVPNTENLRLTGTGPNSTGALESIAGTNSWAGSVILAQDAAFSPATTPGSVVDIGVLPPTSTNLTDSLTITGVISQAAVPLTDTSGTVQVAAMPPLGIAKVGTGVLILDPSSPTVAANTYTGGTTVVAGVVRAEQSGLSVGCPRLKPSPSPVQWLGHSLCPLRGPQQWPFLSPPPPRPWLGT